MNASPMTSPGVKAIALGLLALVLVVPILLVRGLIGERSARANAAEASIAQQWGQAQTFAPAYLVIDDVAAGVAPKDARPAHVLLPDTVSVTGAVATEIRRRGMFSIPVYRTELAVTARFTADDVAMLRAKAGAGTRPELRIAISDARGIQALDALRIDGGALRASARGRGFQGLHALGVAIPATEHDVEVSYRMTLAGVASLQVLPVGRTTNVVLEGAWPHPNFSGAFLPTTRRSGAAGFRAEWSVLEFSRELPQSGPLAHYDGRESGGSAFGVTLYQPANVYQQNERSAKYGILMVALMFIALFLFEILAATPLHPLQYLLVGLALATFYLVLLAVSEHVGFGFAYLLAASAAIAMVAGYAAAILRSTRRAIVLAALQAGAYGVFYVLVRSEDYALLMGALVLSVALAAVMWLTRRIDWYALRPAPASAA